MAETTPTQVDDAGTAPGSELTIPKYRLDEVSAKLKRLEEEVALKDRLYLEDRQRANAERQAPQRPALPTAEELGLDPGVYKAIHTLADKIADQRVSEKEALFGQQIGILAGRTEKAELLSKRGSGEAKYLDEVDRRQKEHFARTGGFLPAEMALDLIKSADKDKEIQERDRQIERLKTQLATGKIPDPEPSGPSGQATRDAPTTGGGGGGERKTFAQLSIQEMEAQMDERFKRGDTV